MSIKPNQPSLNKLKRVQECSPKQAYSKPLEIILDQIAQINSKDYTSLGVYSFYDKIPKLSKAITKNATFHSTDIADKAFPNLESAIKNEDEFAELYIDDFLKNNVYPKLNPSLTSLFNKELKTIMPQVKKYELRQYNKTNSIYAIYTLDLDKIIDLYYKVSKNV